MGFNSASMKRKDIKKLNGTNICAYNLHSLSITLSTNANYFIKRTGNTSDRDIFPRTILLSIFCDHLESIKKFVATSHLKTINFFAHFGFTRYILVFKGKHIRKL